MDKKEECKCYEFAGDNKDCPVDHAKQAHQNRHKELYNNLDELYADYLAQHTGKLPSNTTVLELLQWSYQQTKEPTK